MISRRKFGGTLLGGLLAYLVWPVTALKAMSVKWGFKRTSPMFSHWAEAITVYRRNGGEPPADLRPVVYFWATDKTVSWSTPPNGQMLRRKIELGNKRIDVAPDDIEDLKVSKHIDNGQISFSIEVLCKPEKAPTVKLAD